VIPITPSHNSPGSYNLGGQLASRSSLTSSGADAATHEFAVHAKVAEPAVILLVSRGLTAQKRMKARSTEEGVGFGGAVEVISAVAARLDLIGIGHGCDLVVEYFQVVAADSCVQILKFQALPGAKSNWQSSSNARRQLSIVMNSHGLSQLPWL
jgi:hypothetical protein